MPAFSTTFTRTAFLLGALSVLATAVSNPSIAQDPSGAQPSSDEDRVVAGVSPRDLMPAIAERTRLFPGAKSVPVRSLAQSDLVAVRAEVAGWISEALALLNETPACREVLAARGVEPPGEAAARLSRVVPAGRPIASAPRAEQLLVPDEMPPLSEDDLELMRATGLLPIEIALTGEWARAAASTHAGPVPSDPLLRLTRAARLEGVARLAGIVAAVGGSNVDPRELGSALLTLDRDMAGIPRAELVQLAGESGAAPVTRAALRVLLEDGARWALFHYLRGGADGLAEALERPAVGPEDLLRPGARRRVQAKRPPGCRLGPRGAAALITGEDDPPWIGDLASDSFSVTEDGKLLGWLGFDDEASAQRAADDLTARGLRVEARGPVVVLAL